MLDFDAIDRSAVTAEPFPFFLTESALDAKALARVNGDFPAIRAPGLFPLSELSYGDGFGSLVGDIKSARMRRLMEEKFGVKLEGRPQMITVRAQCRMRDGKIHTDSLDKIVTVLLYLNEKWDYDGGRLRLLRNDHDIEDAIMEVPPVGGTLLAFRRTDNSWHGHLPFAGERRCIMFNWLTGDVKLGKNLLRHKISAKVKKLFAAAEQDNADY